jgi:DNA transformation protein
MFGILADDVLYLKTDQNSARAFREEGMEPFTYVTEGKGPVAMSYAEAPPRLLDEPDELVGWAREAYRVARASKVKRVPKRRGEARQRPPKIRRKMPRRSRGSSS